MTEDEILEGEKSIATFMGYTYFPHNMEGVKVPGWKTTIDTDYMRKNNEAHNFFLNKIHYTGNDNIMKVIKEKTDHPKRKYLCRSHNDLKYSTDWNWLMEVVVKIQTMDQSRYSLTVDHWSMELYDYSNSPEDTIINLEFDYDEKLNMRYFKIILEFIKWYNGNNKGN